MATTVVVDIIEGYEAVDGLEGVTVFTTYLLSGLTGDPKLLMIAALQDTKIPKKGSRHPADRSIVLVRRTARFKDGSPGIVEVFLEYGPPDLGQWEITSTLQTVQTNRTAVNSDELIRVQMNDADGKPLPAQTPTISVRVPLHVRRFSRVELLPPDELSAKFTGAVNSEAGTFGLGLPRQWICAGIGGISLDGGQTWRVSYEFQFNPSPEGWQPFAVYEGSDRRPHPGVRIISTNPDGTINQANGITIVHYHGLLDFGELRLPGVKPNPRNFGSGRR